MDILLDHIMAVVLASLAIAGALGVTIHRLRRDGGAYRPISPRAYGRDADVASAQPLAEKSAPSSSASKMEAFTRRLIGDEAFELMRRRVASLLRIHSADRSTSLWLSGCPGDSTGWRELHSLLPGMPVRLEDVSHDGISAVAVYSREVRVGTLLMTEAEKALRLTGSAHLTGAYVAEQNSYGPCDDMSLKIVVFYRQDETPATPQAGPVTPEESEHDAMAYALTSKYKYIHRGDQPMVIYLN